MNTEDITTNHTSTILKELSDIKSSLAVNTNETANIKARLTDIQADVKEMKTESVSRREFTDVNTTTATTITDMKKDIDFLKKVAYGGLAIVAAVQFYVSFIKP